MFPNIRFCYQSSYILYSFIISINGHLFFILKSCRLSLYHNSIVTHCTFNCKCLYFFSLFYCSFGYYFSFITLHCVFWKFSVESQNKCWKKQLQYMHSIKFVTGNSTVVNKWEMIWRVYYVIYKFFSNISSFYFNLINLFPLPLTGVILATISKKICRWKLRTLHKFCRELKFKYYGTEIKKYKILNING